jgi:hypothetical protein
LSVAAPALTATCAVNAGRTTEPAARPALTATAPGPASLQCPQFSSARTHGASSQRLKRRQAAAATRLRRAAARVRGFGVTSRVRKPPVADCGSPATSSGVPAAIR